MKGNDVAQPGGEVLLYQTQDGKTRLEVQFQGESVWLTQKQMADLFQKDVRTISEHIRNVYEEGELSLEPTLRNFRRVRSEGKRQVERDVAHYNVFTRQARQAPTLEEQRTLQEKTRELEGKKRRQRQQIFEVEDAIAEKRDRLIDQLESRMTQKSQVGPLFTLRWSVV